MKMNKKNRTKSKISHQQDMEGRGRPGGVQAQACAMDNGNLRSAQGTGLA